MAFLTGIEIKKLISQKIIKINSLDPRYPFNADYQVTEDSIDLRIAPAALKFKESVSKIDYLKDDLAKLYELIEIPTEGYILKRGKVLFGQTVEAISIPDTLVGLVVTRNKFARLGLMVNCMAPKFAVGINWAFPLQIVNCNSVPIIIYPYTIMAQLMVSTVQGEPIAYNGKLQNCFIPMPCLIGDRERTALKEITPDAANRTFHILKKELETAKRGIVDEGKKNINSVLVENKTKINLTYTTIIRVILNIVGALGFGIVGNIISSGELSYWKIISMALMTILSLLVILASIFLDKISKKTKSENLENSFIAQDD